MNIPLVPFMLMLSDMNIAHAHEMEQLRLDDQCEGMLSRSVIDCLDPVAIGRAAAMQWDAMAWGVK